MALLGFCTNHFFARPRRAISVFAEIGHFAEIQSASFSAAQKSLKSQS